MRVSTKMTLGLSATCLVIMGLHGWNQLRLENRDLRAEAARQIRLLGDTIRGSVENALRDRQMQDVQGMLAATEKIDPTTDILYFDAGGRLLVNSPGSAADEPLDRRVADAAATGRSTLDFDEATLPGRLVLTVPLHAEADRAGAPIGTLVLVRPLTEMRRDLVDTRRGIIGSVALLVLAATALQFALGTIWVTRPLTTMARAMRQVRSDQWASRLDDPRRDEVGDLAREFDAMVTALQEARARVAREIESRTSLERGLQQVDKLVTVGQISAGLAHEIGSPLQIMSGRARSLLARDHTQEEVRKHARILAEQTDRITRIVEQLLRFARRRPARFVEADLAAAVRAVIDLIEPAARRRGVQLELRADPSLPPVVADVDQIQQIALNLSKNALEASGEGGRIVIRITPATLPGPGGTRRLAAARLEVEDHGRGMSDEVLRRLFEPFFTTRATEGGTGLGMAVVKAIVSEHGGRIAAVSDPGGGSRVTVDLPIGGPHALDEIKEA
jgi:signal transduction histidine kinase